MENRYLSMSRICKHCLLRDMETADKEMIEKYKNSIKLEDRVSIEEYENRLQLCQQCERLNQGTCLACGCYVELRALGLFSHCPHKVW